MTNAETHELWAWHPHYEAWLAVAQGTAAEMRAGAERRYASSRRLELAGSAYTVTRRGVVPGGSPETLCVEVVPEPAPEPQPDLDATLLDQAREGDEAVAAIARVRSVCERQATADGVFVSRADVLRALDGPEA